MARYFYALSCVLSLLSYVVGIGLASSLAGFKEYNRRSNFIQSLDEFTSHEVIKPELHHAQHKRPIRSTFDSESGLHVSHITLSYHHQGQRIVADLHLNGQLIPDGHFLRYQDSKGGDDIVQNFTKTDIDLCHYLGNIRGKPQSRVAVSTCNGGVNGIVHDGADTYLIHSDSDGTIEDDHILFRHVDMINNATCGYNSESNHIHETNERPSEWEHVQNRIDGSEFNRILRYKRSSTDNIIRGPFNANKLSSFVELVIVVDNKVYKSMGENMKKVHKHCKDLANIVNALYEPLNIFIALVGVVVWNESNEIEFSQDADATLKSFLQYRRTKLALTHPNDNAQLLTREQFKGGVVGKALKGPICTYEYSGGVSMEHSQVVAVVAATMAHEIGHNFGMEHDTSDCTCPDEKCIMAASSTSVVPRHWSSCSIDQLNVAFSRGMNYCLRNKPTKLFDSPQCGNGFVEPGEQCDCGLPQYCENSCCDASTCMLKANASCATGECCDFSICRPKSAGTVCRQTENECDLPEFCTGESEYCPANVFKRDTESCDNENAYCYQGSCRSRNNQCRILWGPSGESSENCYHKNVNGSRHGNCGFDRINNKYFQCALEDIRCGMLHCRHLNERLEFGMESVAVLSHSFMNYDGSIIPCRSAIVDLGLQSTDPGLTPNGAKCGMNKMCVNQKCRSIESLRQESIGAACPNNCNGNGVCNSKGNCHCFGTFSPPDCSGPGPGGSQDSGPASNPSSREAFTRFMFILFLGVVPFMALFCLLVCYCNKHPYIPGKLIDNIFEKLSFSMKSANMGGQSSRGPPPPAPNGGLPKSTPSSTDDMNSALLKSPSDSDAAVLPKEMFGVFKGFTMKPLSDAKTPSPAVGPNVAFVHPVSKVTRNESTTTGMPTRPAPPVPKHSTLERMDAQKPYVVENQMKASTLGRLKDGTAPALPPPNPGANPRPIISNPVLEASTCRDIPGHRNMTIPSPLFSPSHNSTVPPPVPPHADHKLFNMKRIPSLLKKEDKYQPKIKPSIDREKLKNIEISAPIPQVDTSNSDSEQQDETKNLVKRAQSMRSPTRKQTSVQTFGSMRNPPGVNRPKSASVTMRPKSPPPMPPPVLKKTNSTTSSGYQLPLAPKPDHTYDDCEAVEVPLSDIKESPSPSGSDNIYSVIEEAAAVHAMAASNDSMGLLGEIVNEIEKRNVDSIYSASTLKNQKPDAEKARQSAPYENIATNEVEPDPEYVKSTSSTSSGGYIRPLAVNTPVARVAPSRPDVTSKNSFSSFKPSSNNVPASQANRTNATSASIPQKSFKSSASPASKAINTKPVDSSKTTKKPLPAGSAPSKPQSKPSVISTKPTGVHRTTSTSKKTADNSANSGVNSSTSKPASRTLSNVASLQQKFETTAKSKGPTTGGLAKK